MNTEEELLKKRYIDLADRAYQRDISTFTNFLGLGDLDVFYQIQNKLQFVPSALYGGADFCERKIIRFGELDTEFPIQCIHVTPILKKFSDSLTHRDFLGALMNLSIKREMIGDILVLDKEAYIFCLTNISDYIIENLSRVKHTVVKCEYASQIPDCFKYSSKQYEYNVASLRLDVIVKEVYHLSRSQSLTIIRERKVFVNGRISENNSYLVKPNDTITVRGYGKFIFGDIVRNTKKGRYFVTANVFK